MAGKTALDAICWLLDRGTAADDITWIRPRDSWLLNRKYFQPGECAMETFEGIVLEIEAVAECDSVEAVYERLEARDVVLRVDRSVVPTMMKGATLSTGELALLRRVEHVVRLGHVERIERDADRARTRHRSRRVPSHLHVHCATHGLSDRPPVPIFTDDTITLQVVSRISLCMSAALLGFVEASGRTTAEKNRLCRPNPWPQTPFDFLRAILLGIRTELAWQDPDLQAWVERVASEPGRRSRRPSGSGSGRARSRAGSSPRCSPRWTTSNNWPRRPRPPSAPRIVEPADG